MNKARALPVNVYRSARIGDCTNGGISAKYNELLIVCEEGFVDVDLDNPPENLARIVKRELFGRVLYHIEPVQNPTGNGWMMGGNYAATSDSRFSRMIGGQYGAVPIHDRQESQELYNMLSH